MSQSSSGDRLPPLVWGVVLVVMFQAIALIVNAILTAVDPGSQELPGTAMVFLIFLFVLGAVWLTAAAIGVLRGRAWPRGALVVAEVLAVIVSFTYFQLGDMLVGSVLLVSGGFVLIGLFTPALNAHMVQRRSRDED